MSTSPKGHVIIGTAGHVDHGKTALIRALTGAETDRLKEEKERGISIDLGFASFSLPGGQTAGIVDVPGHERFISNMLAGIGGIDLVLLVVDVMEGVMPQTREHLEILQLLGIGRGIVVLTKCDLAEDDWIDIVEEEIREEVSPSFMKNAPFCRISSVTGEGLDDLVVAIEEQVSSIVPKDPEGPLRLPIDRHFTVSGFGTVVTGTLLSGSVRTGETLDVLPAGVEARVREIQVHGEKVGTAFAGQRVALNLAGVGRDKIARGSVVGTPGIFAQTERIDARLTLLPGAPRPLKFRDPVHVYLGTAKVVGLVALLDRDEMKPGESALVQIHLDHPFVAHRQDRFVIRSYSPMTTIGGGIVVDPRPVKHRRFRKEVLAALAELETGEVSFLLQKLSERSILRPKEMEVLTGLGRERIAAHLATLEAEGKAAQLGEQWVASEFLHSFVHIMKDATERFHNENPLQPGIPHATLKRTLPEVLSPKAFDALLETLCAEEALVQQGEWLRLPAFTPTPTEAQVKEISRIEETYREEGPQAKNKKEMLDRLGLAPDTAEPFFAYLIGRGRLVRLNEESLVHAETYATALDLMRDHFATHETLTLATLRDLLGSSRKQVQAILEYFDALKYTMRRGDERVAWKLPSKDNERRSP